VTTDGSIFGGRTVTGKVAKQLPKLLDQPREGGIVALIDDDANLRRALQRVLGAMGFAVASFGSAEDFLASRHRSDFSCLLSDINLPGISGIELCARLTAAADPLPVILMSSTAAPSVIRRTFGDAVCVLSKPLDAELLEIALSVHHGRDGRSPATRE
jgi:FixJ family two-component response regulator